jgi:hypothetical protein
MSGEFLMGLPRLWRVANPVVASVFADFEYALTHAEAGESNVRNAGLVDPVEPRPGWTQRQLRRAQTPRRSLTPDSVGGADQK